MQTSGANSEHKHSEMERFSTLNYSGFRFMPRFSFCFFLNSIIVSKFSDLH